MLLRIDTNVEGDTLSVQLAGEFDMGSIGDFREAVEGASEPWQRAEIDLRDVVFMDSSGLQELVRLNNRAHERNLEVVLTTPSAPVMRLLELTGLQSHFTIRD
jgi:anti-sigma B factor antagonist